MQVMLRRLWIQITADRKRFGLLCGMLLIGLLLWGRIIITSDMPRTAIADPEAAPANPTGANGATSPDKREVPVITLQLSRAPIRDPLVISDQYFPKATAVESLPQDGSKFGPDATDDLVHADRRRTQELWSLVGRFRLDGVMQGRPMAVINGKTHRLYAWIPAVEDDNTFFQLVEVAHRSVVLECDGRRFRLNMDSGIEER